MKNVVLALVLLFYIAKPDFIFAQEEIQADSTISLIDPYAIELIGYSSSFLKELTNIRVEAKITKDLIDHGNHKLQFTKFVEMQLKKPSRLRAFVTGDLEQRSFWCNGKKLTVLEDRDGIHYASFDVEGTLDKTLNKAIDEFGIELPLADIIYSDAFENVYDAILEGYYIDKSEVNGHDCHHLAFYQENIDWQVWIQDGPSPILRKILITHKDLPGAPQFGVEFIQFDFLSEIPDQIFEFLPPPGSVEVELIKNDN